MASRVVGAKATHSCHEREPRAAASVAEARLILGRKHGSVIKAINTNVNVPYMEHSNPANVVFELGIYIYLMVGKL